MTRRRRKKAKKTESSTTSPEDTAAAAPAPAVEESSTILAPADMKSILALRSQKGGKSSKTPTISEAQKIALAEAKSATKKKSTKRDKSKFSEGSY